MDRIIEIWPWTAFDENKPHQKFKAYYRVDMETLVITTQWSNSGMRYTTAFNIELERALQGGLKNKARAYALLEGNK